MFDNCFDHPLIEGWREALLRAQLKRENTTTPKDRPLQGLEVLRVEPLPDIGVKRSRAL
jgi:hypothetical protein